MAAESLHYDDRVRVVDAAQRSGFLKSKETAVGMEMALAGGRWTQP